MTSTKTEQMKVGKRDIYWLKMAAFDTGMYPGDYWEAAPKRYASLEKRGLVYLYTPHNPVHKYRAAITEKGREVLAIAAKENKDEG